MAVHNDLRDEERINIDQPWEGLSGKVVEDAITRKVLENSNNTIVGGTYNQGKSQLILTKKDGTELPGIDIIVAEPSYDYSIIFYGIRINGVVYDNNTESILTQYINKDKTKEIMPFVILFNIHHLYCNIGRIISAIRMYITNYIVWTCVPSGPSYIRNAKSFFVCICLKICSVCKKCSFFNSSGILGIYITCFITF